MKISDPIVKSVSKSTTKISLFAPVMLVCTTYPVYTSYACLRQLRLFASLAMLQTLCRTSFAFGFMWTNPTFAKLLTLRTTRPPDRQLMTIWTNRPPTTDTLNHCSATNYWHFGPLFSRTNGSFWSKSHTVIATPLCCNLALCLSFRILLAFCFTL